MGVNKAYKTQPNKWSARDAWNKRIILRRSYTQSDSLDYTEQQHEFGTALEFQKRTIKKKHWKRPRLPTIKPWIVGKAIEMQRTLKKRVNTTSIDQRMEQMIAAMSLLNLAPTTPEHHAYLESTLVVFSHWVSWESEWRYVPRPGVRFCLLKPQQECTLSDAIARFDQTEPKKKRQRLKLNRRGVLADHMMVNEKALSIAKDENRVLDNNGLVMYSDTTFKARISEWINSKNEEASQRKDFSDSEAWRRLRKKLGKARSMARRKAKKLSQQTADDLSIRDSQSLWGHGMQFSRPQNAGNLRDS